MFTIDNSVNVEAIKSKINVSHDVIYRGNPC